MRVKGFYIPRAVLILAPVLLIAVTLSIFYHFTPKSVADTPAQGVNSAWVMNAGAGLYGRVNVGGLELDAKEQIASGNSFRASQVLQIGNDGYLTSGGKALKLSSERPAPIDDDAVTDVFALAGRANKVEVSGDYAMMLSSDGSLYWTQTGNIDNASNLASINREDDKFVAASIDKRGLITAYSDAKTLVQYDVNTSKFVHEVLNVGPKDNVDYSTDTFQVTSYGALSRSKHNTSVLLYRKAGETDTQIWIQDKSYQMPEVVGMDAQLSLSSSAEDLYIAGSSGLFTFKNGEASNWEVLGEAFANETALPARPIVGRTCINDEEKLEVFAVWSTARGILASTCEGVEMLTDSANSSGTKDAIDRGLTLRRNGDAIVLNAVKTGEVWVNNPNGSSFGSSKWRVVLSTLNNWETQLNKNQDETQKEPPKSNMCPIPPVGEAASFGVRPGKDNRIPVLLGARDANRGDILSIVSISKVSNGSLGDFRIIDNGQAIAVVTPPAAGQTRNVSVTVEVTDGGTDAGGVCKTPMTFQITEHPYSEPNQTPKQLGNGVAEDRLIVSKYPATDSVDGLQGWMDPDGDDLYLQSSGILNEGKAVVSPTGIVTFQPENVAIGAQKSVGLIVLDSLGASTRTSLTFSVFDEAPPTVDSLTVSTAVGVSQTVDFSSHVYGMSNYWSVEIIEKPDDVHLTLNATGQIATLSSDKIGNYQITYQVPNTMSPGIINFSVHELQNTNDVSVSPTSLYVQNGEDTSLDISNLVQNTTGAALALNSVSITPERSNSGELLANIEANIIDSTHIRVEGSLLSSANSELVHRAGNVLLSYDIVDANGVNQTSISSGVSVFITTPIETIAPIAVSDQAVVHAGESVDIDVLSNDVSAFGDAILLDPRHITAQNEISATGLAFSVGSKLRYIAPSNMTNDIISVDYWVYTRGHSQTGRARGIVNIKITNTSSSAPVANFLTTKMGVGQSVQLDIPKYGIDADGNAVKVVKTSVISGDGVASVSEDGSAVKITHVGSSAGLITANYTISDGIYDTTGKAQVIISESLPQPVGFRDYLYGANGAKVRINPLDNDIIPSGMNGKLKKCKLLQLNGTAEESIPTREITDDDSLENLYLEIGENGDTTEWECIVDLLSKGETPDHQLGEKVGTYNEYITLNIATEDTVPVFPQLKDTSVSTSEIEHRKTFNTDITRNFLYTEGSLDDFELLNVGEFNKENSLTFEGAKTKGNMLPTEQTLVFQAVQRDDSSIQTYGIIRVPGLDLILPTRINDEVKTVSVAGPDLEINIVDEVQPLEDSVLTVSGDVVHSQLRPQSSCTISGNTLRYTPGKMRSDLTIDTDIHDSCGVYAGWDEEEKTKQLINFIINIVPEVVDPSLTPSPLLEEIEPKAEREDDLMPYLKWYGHPQSEIESLNVICSSDAAITVSCSGTKMHISTPRDATELVDHPINISIQGFEKSAQIWQLHIKAAPKFSDIQVPVHEQEVVIQEGKEPPTVDVSDDVRAWLSRPEFYDFQDGGSITCAPVQDPKVVCAEAGGLGVLKFSIAAGAEDTGFMTIGRYAFTDRAQNASPNRGTGTVRINYQALPKRPPQPALNGADAQNGIVTLTLTEGAVSVPPTQEICLRVRETSQELCKPSGSMGSVSFTSRDGGELAGLEKWKTFTFVAVVKNIVGESPESVENRGTPFIPLESPTVTWWVSDDHLAHIQIANGDTHTKQYEVNSGAGQTWNVNYGDSVPSFSLSAAQSTTVTVTAHSQEVISGDGKVTPADAKPVSVTAVMPGEPLTSEISNIDDAIKRTTILSATFSASQTPGTKYQYAWVEGDVCDDASSQYITAQNGVIEPKLYDDLEYLEDYPYSLCTRSVLDTTGLSDFDAAGNQYIGKVFYSSQKKIIINLPFPLTDLPGVTYCVTYNAQSNAGIIKITPEKYDINKNNKLSSFATILKLSDPTPTSNGIMKVKLSIRGKEISPFSIPADPNCAQYIPVINQNYTYNVNGDTFTFPSMKNNGISNINDSDFDWNITFSDDFSGFSATNISPNLPISFSASTLVTNLLVSKTFSGTATICAQFKNKLENYIQNNQYCFAPQSLSWTYNPAQPDPDPTDPTDPADPADPTDPADPADPADPSGD